MDERTNNSQLAGRTNSIDYINPYVAHMKKKVGRENSRVTRPRIRWKLTGKLTFDWGVFGEPLGDTLLSDGPLVRRPISQKAH